MLISKRTTLFSLVQDVSRDIIEAAKTLIVKLSKEEKEKNLLEKIR
jgi:hypothetical protein